MHYVHVKMNANISVDSYWVSGLFGILHTITIPLSWMGADIWYQCMCSITHCCCCCCFAWGGYRSTRIIIVTNDHLPLPVYCQCFQSVTTLYVLSLDS